MIRLIMNKKLRSQAGGQVVLMVLLASVLVLTLGLSAARQTTVETSIDTDQELLKKAFNAAESGIDYYLKTGNTQYGTSDSPEGSSTLTKENLGGNDKTLSFNRKIGSEDSEFFWLVNHNQNGDIGNTYYSDSDNTIDICSSDLTTAVNFKIDYFYKEGTSYKVIRGDGSNSVLQTSGGLSNCISNYSLQPTVSSKSILLVATPVGVNTQISIKGGVNFPIQGEKLKSVGSVGRVNNMVTIDRQYKLIPFLLEPVVSEGVVTNSD